MSLIKCAINLSTFGPKAPGDILPLNPFSERKKPILNKVKIKHNETVADWGLPQNGKLKEIADTLNTSYSEGYWQKDMRDSAHGTNQGSS